MILATVGFEKEQKLHRASYPVVYFIDFAFKESIFLQLLSMSVKFTKSLSQLASTTQVN